MVKHGRKNEKTFQNIYEKQKKKKSKRRKASAKGFFREGKNKRYIPPDISEYMPVSNREDHYRYDYLNNNSH